MVKFIHMGDCHLGGWRHPELQELNFKSFQHVIDFSIKEKVNFVLIAGDLFDSPYPSIDTIKETFGEFRRLKEANIPVFLIAGSHDYSVSGKSFLDVLEKAGFAKNVHQSEEKNGSIILLPTIYKNIAIYGYPGKKSAMEIKELQNFKIHDSPGLFKILMLHTALSDAIAVPIDTVDPSKLPKVDYVALAHLHVKYEKENRVYCGPTFPNNLAELEELKHGSFYLFNNGKVERKEIKLKETLVFDIPLTDAFLAAETVTEHLSKDNLKDKIIILKLKGVLEKGRISNIDFSKIEDFIKKQGAYVLLKHTSKLQAHEPEFKMEIKSENLEKEVISTYKEDNPNKFNSLINDLMYALQAEKKEDETSKVFEERILSESKKVIASETT